MGLIERLLGHGRWFTDMFLEAARPLPDEQLDREFDIGHRTSLKTEVHMVNVITAETARLRGMPPGTGGGTALYVIMQNLMRLSELRHILVRLGVEDLMEGDVQEWEHVAGLINRWGGQYPDGFVRPWAS